MEGDQMYNTIIVPIDLSHEERAAHMIDAAKLLGGSSAKIYVLNVFDDVPGYVAAELPADIIENSKSASMQRLDAIVADKGVDAETIIRTGQPARGILDLAEDVKAELIVIASHKPGFQDYLLGSTASRVVRHATCPVFVIR